METEPVFESVKRDLSRQAVSMWFGSLLFAATFYWLYVIQYSNPAMWWRALVELNPWRKDLRAQLAAVTPIVLGLYAFPLLVERLRISAPPAHHAQQVVVARFAAVSALALAFCSWIAVPIPQPPSLTGSPASVSWWGDTIMCLVLGAVMSALWGTGFGNSFALYNRATKLVESIARLKQARDTVARQEPRREAVASEERALEEAGTAAEHGATSFQPWRNSGGLAPGAEEWFAGWITAAVMFVVTVAVLLLSYLAFGRMSSCISGLDALCGMFGLVFAAFVHRLILDVHRLVWKGRQDTGLMDWCLVVFVGVLAWLMGALIGVCVAVGRIRDFNNVNLWGLTAIVFCIPAFVVLATAALAWFSARESLVTRCRLGWRARLACLDRTIRQAETDRAFVNKRLWYVGEAVGSLDPDGVQRRSNRTGERGL